MTIRVLAFSVLFAATSVSAMEGYYTSPALRGDAVVFTAEGDLWIHHLGEAQAERLTTHPTLETQASISPDGKNIAFAADYEGVQEIYLMPVSGGVPKRLTYENSGVVIHEWTADGRILYSTIGRAGPPSYFILKTVNPTTLETGTLPLADAFGGSIDARREYVYFTQFGLGISGDSANIYRGGMLGKLWRYRLGSNDEASRIAAEHLGSVRRPMVSGEKLYFISDASGRDNIWSMDLDGSNAEQITQHDEFSIRAASLDNGRVIYQLGADLQVLDLASRKSSKLNIQLASDHPSLREQWVTDPLTYITSARLSGDFDKVVVTARGRAAIAGIDQTRLVSVGSPIDSRLRNASLSHDGKSVYAISDASGETELWRYDATGATAAVQLTKDGSGLRGDFVESPDGEWVAHHDGNGGLWLLNTKTQKNKRIADDSLSLQKIVWSPDSKRLAITHNTMVDFRPRLFLYDIDSGKQAYLTSDNYEAGTPAFSRDGTWLYFLSNRHFANSSASVWTDRDFGPEFIDRTEVYALALTEEAEFPFAIPTELSAPKPEQDEVAEDEDEKADEPAIVVAWDGLLNRIWQVPLPAGNYTDLLVNEGLLYVQSVPNAPDAKSEIKVLKLEPLAEAAAFTDNVISMGLSDNGEKLFVWRQSAELPELYIVPAEDVFPEDLSKNTVQVDGWQFSIDPRLEWEQFFHDAWLMHREQFYDARMRGVDWEAMKQKYTPLARRVTERRELNDVLAQMMGELNALHSSIRGGDVPVDPETPVPASLGALLEQTAKGVAIEHIYRHDAELPSLAPPLARPGVDAAEGDIIVSINGIETPTLELLHRALRNQAGKQVLLQLRRERKEVKTVVVPVDADGNYTLVYSDWVNRNRSKVVAKDADIAYLHLEAMGEEDVASFARDFYANLNKKGMVIDVRRNNGGNVDSWIIDRLLRKAWSFWTSRQGGDPYTNMQNTFRGHLVVLADERTYSDGETFVAAIKQL
ncbi:MAG: PD40 domain-containing protein, partial [Woeseiaceae bacterium]|nr:PD40 domain-containing protein [Woeseiaceae bacterium]